MRTLAAWLAALMVALAATVIVPPPALAQDGAGDTGLVRFGETRVENAFPDSLTLSTTVDAAALDVARAEIIVRPRTVIGFANPATIPVRVSQTGDALTLTFRFNSNGTAIPHLPLRYTWVVEDVDGARYESAEAVVVYEDSRFVWQTLENDRVAVLWHSRPDSFGRTVFDIANAALEQQEPLFGEPLDFPITILIYNDVSEFGAWNPLAVSERIGGQAFPDYGITTQIVSPFGSQERWLNEVIPHELAHLYFAQATYSVSEKPQWLDEGVATYVENGVNKQALLRSAQRAAEDGTLIQLGRLDRQLGNEERTELLYAQGVSVVTFLVEEYGEEQLAALFEAYDNGANSDTAFEQTFGLDLGGIQAAWLTWLGVSAENYPTPTPWPLPTPFPSPTPFVPVALATDTPDPTPAAVAQAATATPTPEPAATATATATAPAPATAPATPVIIGNTDSLDAAPLVSDEKSAASPPAQTGPDETVAQSVFPIGVALFVISMCAFWPALSVVILVTAARARDRALGI